MILRLLLLQTNKQTVGGSSQHLNLILNAAKPLHTPTPINIGAFVLPAQIA